MKIHGNRVYLLLPTLPESKVELSPEFKKQMQEEAMLKFERLEVFGIGEGVNSSSAITISSNPLKVGDLVKVDPTTLRRSVTFKIDDKELICVNSLDIMHTW